MPSSSSFKINEVGIKDNPDTEMEATKEMDRPSKRLKLDSDQQSTSQVHNSLMTDPRDPTSVSTSDSQVDSVDAKATMEAQILKESEVGIIGYVSASSEGFTGILKKRYTDFLVNEILPNGEVCHLRTTKAPKANRREAQEQSRDDEAQQAKVEAKQDHPVEQKENEPLSATVESTDGDGQHSATNGENGTSDNTTEVMIQTQNPK
jgi:hypothetical protein